MTLWPQTLLARSVLLIAILLVLAHLAWLQIFRVSTREPRARQVSQQIISTVNLTRAALVTAEPSKRYSLLGEIAEREGVQVHVAQPGETLAPLPKTGFYEFVEADLRGQLGAATKFTLARNGVEGIWVSFDIDSDSFWMLMPESRLASDESLRWIGWGALVLLLAVGGAVLIVARINRPLRALTQAAAQMGRGATPAPVDENGPTEIRTLSRAFNQMAADRKALDDERALLLAGVSHDLRTPLARIRLGIEMLDDKGDASIRDGIVQDIEDIDAAINQFLDFARAASSESETPDANLNELVAALAPKYARAGKPFLALNCAAISPNLVEPTLFGYSKGAFTGATAGGYLYGNHGGLALFAFCGILLALWLVLAATMKAPAAVRTKMYHVQEMDTSRASDLSRELASLSGVHEALVLANERVAYLKVDMRGFNEERVVQLLGGEA